MFLGNSKIENALKIINEIEDGKFPLLLNRIAQFLSNSSSGRPFTPVEETKLETSLEITKAEVETLINGIIEIFLASAYCVLKPSLLGEQLEVLRLNAKKTEAFVQVWAASAKGIVDNLKQKSFFPQLDHISYSLSVKTASESVSKEKSPKAQLQLNLSSAQKTEDINLEFNHEELCELYKKLEQVQGQLDALRGFLLENKRKLWKYNPQLCMTCMVATDNTKTYLPRVVPNTVRCYISHGVTPGQLEKYNDICFTSEGKTTETRYLRDVAGVSRLDRTLQRRLQEIDYK